MDFKKRFDITLIFIIGLLIVFFFLKMLKVSIVYELETIYPFAFLLSGIISIILSYYTYSLYKNLLSKRFLFLGMAFLTLAITDIIFGIQVLLLNQPNLNLWQYLNGILIASILLFLSSRLNPAELKKSIDQSVYFYAIVFVVLGLHLVYVTMEPLLPKLWIMSTGSTLLANAIYLATLGFFAGTTFYYSKSFLSVKTEVTYWLVNGSLVFMISHLSIFLSSEPYDIFNWLGIAFRTLSLVIFIYGVLKSPKA